MASASGSNVNRSGYNRPANPNAAVYQSKYADENPYASIDPTDQLSGWQNFWDRLGVTDYAGKAIYKHNMQVADYDSQLAARDYNSEVAQVERANRAGLNSDLLGVNRNEYAPSPAGAGAAMDETSLQSFGNLFPMLGSAITNAFSLWKGFAEVANSNISADAALTGMDFSANKKTLAGLASAMLANSKYSPDEIVTAFKNRDVPTDMLGSSDVRGYLDGMTAHFRTKRQKEYALRQLNNYLDSEEFMHDVLSDYSRSNDVLSNAVTSSGNLAGQFDKGLVNGVKTLWKLNYDVTKLEQQYRKDYYSNISGANMADYTESSARVARDASLQNYNFQKQVNNHLLTAVNKLIKGDTAFEHFLAAEILKGSLSSGSVVSGALDIVKLAMPGR